MKTIEEIKAELMSKPMAQIIDIAATALFENQSYSKIVISQEEFDAHFRIRGINAEGNVELRGRKPKAFKKVD